MKTNVNCQFEIRVNNALDFLGDEFARFLNTSNNTISGWIREERIDELRNHFEGLEINIKYE